MSASVCRAFTSFRAIILGRSTLTIVLSFFHQLPILWGLGVDKLREVTKETLPEMGRQVVDVDK